MSTPRFPRIVTETLAGTPLVLPDSLQSDVALVVLVFRRHAQAVVDSWMRPVERIAAGLEGVQLYEVPVLSGGWRMVSGFIDGGMRAGIPIAKHDSIATYYGDLGRFRTELGIHDLDSAYPFLIDEDGTIIWHASGWASREALDGLEAVLASRVA